MSRANAFRQRVENLKESTVYAYSNLPEDVQAYIEDGTLAAKGNPLIRNQALSSTEKEILSREGFHVEEQDKSTGDHYTDYRLQFYYFFT